MIIPDFGINTNYEFTTFMFQVSCIKYYTATKDWKKCIRFGPGQII